MTTLLQRIQTDALTISDVINLCGKRQNAADAAGVSRKTIHNWLNGIGEPSFSQGLRLCAASGINPATVAYEPSAHPQQPANHR